MIDVTWVGHDGSIWELTKNDAVGGWQTKLIAESVRGFGEPEYQFFDVKSPALDGATRTGWRAEPREIFLPVILSAANGSELVELERRFLNSFDVMKTGTLTVESPFSTRTIDCVLTPEQMQYASDPSLESVITYGVKLTALSPWWRGPAVSWSWSGSDTGGDGGDVMSRSWSISRASSYGSAYVSNPGDVPAYPIWTVNGPCSSVTMGVSGRKIEVPFEVSDTSTLKVYTQPDLSMARLNNVDITRNMGALDFAPIPPGADVRLEITLNGSGSVLCEFAPCYRRAW